MGMAPIASKWFGPIFIACIVAFAFFSYVSFTWQQKQIVQRAKAAGISLNSEEKKQIEDLGVLKAKMLRALSLIALGTLILTGMTWTRQS